MVANIPITSFGGHPAFWKRGPAERCPDPCSAKWPSDSQFGRKRVCLPIRPDLRPGADCQPYPGSLSFPNQSRLSVCCWIFTAANMQRRGGPAFRGRMQLTRAEDAAQLAQSVGGEIGSGFAKLLRWDRSSGAPENLTIDGWIKLGRHLEKLSLVSPTNYPISV